MRPSSVSRWRCGMPAAEQHLVHGVAAPDQEGNMVGAPQLLDGVHLVDELAVAIEAITRQVRADVAAGSRSLRLRIARIGDLQQGTGLGVALAEAQEVEGKAFSHDRQVGLHVAARQSMRGPRPAALAHRRTHLAAGCLGEGLAWWMIGKHRHLPRLPRAPARPARTRSGSRRNRITLSKRPFDAAR